MPLKLRDRVPLGYSLALQRIQSNKRGGYALLRLLKALGQLNSCASFELGSGTIQMPLYTAALETGKLFEIYERDALNAMAQCIRAMGEATVVIDCGADVGVYSRLLLERTAAFRELIALEPNTLTYPVLEHNLRGSSVATTLLAKGVARTPGRGTLRQPDYDDSERSFFIDASGGNLELTTLDMLTQRLANSPIAVKIDVEGAEFDVIQGGRHALARASHFTVQFEAHPQVTERTGIDPTQCLSALIELGAKSWTVCEEGAGHPLEGLHANSPFFDQFPKGRIFDIVATTLPGQFPDGV